MNALLCPAMETPPLLESNGILTFEPGGAQCALLKPAGWAFGRGRVRVSAVLGACVAMVFWAPRQRIGAMVVCTQPARVAGSGPRIVSWAQSWAAQPSPARN